MVKNHRVGGYLGKNRTTFTEAHPPWEKYPYNICSINPGWEFKLFRESLSQEAMETQESSGTAHEMRITALTLRPE